MEVSDATTDFMKPKTANVKRKTVPRSLDRLVREPIFSGARSEDLWRHINGATNSAKLRAAIYLLACHCQELEAEVERLSNDRMSRGANND